MAHSYIKGLKIIENFITADDEAKIIKAIDAESWSSAIGRRTQQYGYVYDYKTKSKSGVMAKATKDISEVKELANVADKLKTLYDDKLPTQCIINEYLRNQGISAHIDSPIFGPVIVSISLGADCNMTFTAKKNTAKETSYTAETGDVVGVCLPRLSAVVLTGESRYIWTHEIPAHTTYNNSTGESIKKAPDYRRVSLTFRTLAEKK